MNTTTTRDMPREPDEWVLCKRGLLFRQGGGGYTRHISEAERYSRQGALRFATITEAVTAHPVSDFVDEFEIREPTADAVTDLCADTGMSPQDACKHLMQVEMRRVFAAIREGASVETKLNFLLDRVEDLLGC